MQAVDAVRKNESFFTAIGSKVLPVSAETPLGMLLYAVVGPFFLTAALLLSTKGSGVSLAAVLSAFFGVVALLLWREKGLYTALALPLVAFIGRSLTGACGSVVWEIGYFTSLASSLYITSLCFSECIYTYESTTIAIADDFEKLKEVHSKYTREKTEECEKLKKALAFAQTELTNSDAELHTLKKIVHASSAQASSYAEKNAELQEQSYTLLRELSEARQLAQKGAAQAEIQQKMLAKLNQIRVDHYQQQLLCEVLAGRVKAFESDPIHVVEQMAPSSQEETPVSAAAEDSPFDAMKEKIAEKEKEKTTAKKVYYEHLDSCNDLKAVVAKDPQNAEAKEKYDAAFATLKEKKAALVEIEKQLFSLKKELRDNGALFS